MNTTATPTYTPRALLSEALDTIKATFWIKDKEFKWLSDWSDEEGRYVGLDAFIPKVKAGEIKGKVIEDNRTNGRSKGVVTGMCSIGAIALARHTLYETDESEGLLSYSTCELRDPVTRIAGAALSNVILGRIAPGEEVTSAGNAIAHYNDQPDTTREDVVSAFEEAIASDISAATELWQVSTFPFFFTSEEAAQAHIDRWITEIAPKFVEFVKEQQSNPSYYFDAWASEMELSYLDRRITDYFGWAYNQDPETSRKPAPRKYAVIETPELVGA